MKIYTGSEECRYCHKTFVWKFRDDEHRSQGEYVSNVFEVPEEPEIAWLGRNTVIPEHSEFLTGYCPHCGSPVAIECNERILKELCT